MTVTQPQAYLLDVEGTVAPISLVAEQLFPYARAHFESYLTQIIDDFERSTHGGDVACVEGSDQWDLTLLKMENMNETDPDAPKLTPPGVSDPANFSMSPAAFRQNGIPRFLKYIFWLMDRDRKSTALKSLQGKIWQAGFESGQLKGTLFPDVPPAFARWARDAKVAIYSSGSVEAQRLLFRYSNYGDLTPLITSYFDTRTGAKSERSSYAAIASKLDVLPATVIFYSDVVRELDAARAAGCQTRLVVREGNAPVEDAHGHPSITDLA